MKILAISDVIVPYIYSSRVVERFGDVNLLISCGDLPYYYQEYVTTLLNVPAFYVRGNHSRKIVRLDGETQTKPLGGVDLHRNVVDYKGLLMAGVEGSLRYSGGPYQYTQEEMWLHVLHLFPGLLKNRMLKGRYLDIFVTHAPPSGIHSETDLPHQGIHAFRWLLKVFKPAYLLHGHIHIYNPETIRKTYFDQTLVINVFRFYELTVRPGIRPVPEAARG